MDTLFKKCVLFANAFKNNMVKYKSHLMGDRGSFSKKKMRAFLVISFIYFLRVSETHAGKLDTLLQWETLEFDYSDSQKVEDLKSGFYVPTASMPMDVDVIYNDDSTRRIFVTIPRYVFGTPATLVEYIGDDINGTSYLRPYPSWHWHRNETITECKRDRLVTVPRIKIDKCGRMWVSDFGVITNYVKCPAQIIAFDLSTNKVVHQFTIPEEFYISGYSGLFTPVVDIQENNCDEGFIYIADCREAGILTYNIKTRKISRSAHRTMFANPYYGSYNVLGSKFDLMDAVIGMDLEPYKGKSDRALFYSALSSVTMNRVNTSVLQNQDAFLKNPNSNQNDFKEYKSKRYSQSHAIAIDRNGIMYSGDLIASGIICWNTKSSDYGKFIDTVYYNKTTLQWASGVKVIDHPSGSQELWVLSSRYQRIATNTLDPKDTNFRISVGKIPEILKGTFCGKPNQIPFRYPLKLVCLFCVKKGH